MLIEYDNHKLHRTIKVSTKQELILTPKNGMEISDTITVRKPTVERYEESQPLYMYAPIEHLPLSMVSYPVTPRPRREVVKEIKRDPLIEAFNQEREAFRRIEGKLLKKDKYLGMFIAIYKGQIVDVDEDRSALAKRVYDCNGYVPIYINRIEKKKKIREMPSRESRV